MADKKSKAKSQTRSETAKKAHQKQVKKFKMLAGLILAGSTLPVAIDYYLKNKKN